MIQADQLSSIIFSGPPGTGKTTLAWVIANTTRSAFITMNAVLSGVKDLRGAIEEAKTHKDLYGRRTILFVDEVHRWNKAQQDALLPWVENGTVILIGATTENPFFEVNAALVSRSRIFQLTPLTAADLRRVLDQAIRDSARGYGKYHVDLDEDAAEHLIDVCGGDARTLLNALELAVETTPAVFPPPEGEAIRVTLEIAEQSIQRRAVLYDKEGDYHFDTISAFIKSLRGSDPDAALYWLARMVQAGEDPRFIFRRMLILACEDVGLADPNALVVVESAAAAFDRIGLPEGRFHLAHAALYLAICPKSNSTLGFFEALRQIEEAGTGAVPSHLKDASRDKNGFGHGDGYLYPHSFKDHWVSQQYLPSELQGMVFYHPSDQGWEGVTAAVVSRRRELQLEAASAASPEILTFSSDNTQRNRWLKRIRNDRLGHLEKTRAEVFQGIPVARHWRVIDMEPGAGLLLWEAVRLCPEGSVWALVETEEKRSALEARSAGLPPEDRPRILVCSIDTLSAKADISPSSGHEKAQLPPFELAVGRDMLTMARGRKERIAVIRGLLAENGWLSLCEIVPSRCQRLSNLEASAALSTAALDSLRETEERIFADPAYRYAGTDASSLEAAVAETGFLVRSCEEFSFPESRMITDREVDSWFSATSDGLFAVTLRTTAPAAQLSEIRSWASLSLKGTTIPWNTTRVFLKAVRI
jgi:putative ATPase